MLFLIELSLPLKDPVILFSLVLFIILLAPIVFGKLGLPSLTDFTLDKKTGDIKQVGDPNKNPDRILKTDKHGNVKKKGEGFLGSLVRESRRGDPKVAVGGIKQGILKDGGNFQTKNNVIDIGGQGQPTREGVEDFALKLSSYVGKEVGGFYLSAKGKDAISHIYIGAYENNDAQNERSNFRLDSYEQINNKTPISGMTS